MPWHGLATIYCGWTGTCIHGFASLHDKPSLSRLIEHGHNSCHLCLVRNHSLSSRNVKYIWNGIIEYIRHFVQTYIGIQSTLLDEQLCSFFITSKVSEQLVKCRKTEFCVDFLSLDNYETCISQMEWHRDLQDYQQESKNSLLKLV